MSVQLKSSGVNGRLLYYSFTFNVFSYRSTAITDDQARDAMFQFVSEHCCYGKAPAQEMVIKDIVPSSAYHVGLLIETFQ